MNMHVLEKIFGRGTLCSEPKHLAIAFLHTMVVLVNLYKHM